MRQHEKGAAVSYRRELWWWLWVFYCTRTHLSSPTTAAKFQKNTSTRLYLQQELSPLRAPTRRGGRSGASPGTARLPPRCPTARARRLPPYHGERARAGGAAEGAGRARPQTGGLDDNRQRLQFPAPEMPPLHPGLAALVPLPERELFPWGIRQKRERTALQPALCRLQESPISVSGTGYTGEGRRRGFRRGCSTPGLAAQPPATRAAASARHSSPRADGTAVNYRQ